MTCFSKHSFIEIQPESLVCIFCIITIELSIQDKVSRIKIKDLLPGHLQKKNTKLPSRELLAN